MRKKIIITAIGLLLLIGFGVFGYLLYLDKMKYIDVYIASHNISQRSLITQRDLVKIRLPSFLISDDIYTSDNEIIGKYNKLAYSIPKGSFFYKNVLEIEGKDIANTLLKKGEISYDIYVNEVKINPGSIDKNMCLDFYLTIDDKEKVISDLLLSNARIIGIYNQNGKAIEEYDKNSKIYIISVAVNKEDVVILNKAMVLGDIRVVTSSNTYEVNSKTIQNKQSELYEYLK